MTTKEKSTETEVLNGTFVIYEVETDVTNNTKNRDRLLGFGKKKAQAILANIEEIKKFAES